MDEKWRKSNTQGWWLIHKYFCSTTHWCSFTDPSCSAFPRNFGITSSFRDCTVLLVFYQPLLWFCPLSLSEWELWKIFFGSTCTRDFHLDNLQKSQCSMLSKRHLSSPHIPLLQCSCNCSTLPSVGSSAPYWSTPPFIHHLRSITKSWVIHF